MITLSVHPALVDYHILAYLIHFFSSKVAIVFRVILETQTYIFQSIMLQGFKTILPTTFLGTRYKF